MKKDSNTMNQQCNTILKSTGDVFKETFLLFKDFKEFKFPQKSDQISYNKQIRIFESRCNEMKTEFDNLTFKITKQNKSILESNRNSRLSIGNSFSQNDFQKVKVIQGVDLLSEERLIEKEKQNLQIEQ